MLPDAQFGTQLSTWLVPNARATEVPHPRHFRPVTMSLPSAAKVICAGFHRNP
jgi:hypothetical protein